MCFANASKRQVLKQHHPHKAADEANCSHTIRIVCENMQAIETTKQNMALLLSRMQGVIPHDCVLQF